MSNTKNKCNSFFGKIFGHKPFIIYEYGEPTIVPTSVPPYYSQLTGFGLSSPIQDAKIMMMESRPRKYIKTICKRCGQDI